VTASSSTRTDRSRGEVRPGARHGGIDGVEVVFPYEVDSPQRTAELVRKHGLHIAAVNVNIKGEPEFKSGSLTVESREIRQRAVKFLKDGKDFAPPSAPTGSPAARSPTATSSPSRRTTAPRGAGWRSASPRRAPTGPRSPSSSSRSRARRAPPAPSAAPRRPPHAEGHRQPRHRGHGRLRPLDLRGNNPARRSTCSPRAAFPTTCTSTTTTGAGLDLFCGTRHFLEYASSLYLMRNGYRDYLTSDTSRCASTSRGVRGQQPGDAPHLAAAGAAEREGLRKARRVERLPRDLACLEEGSSAEGASMIRENRVLSTCAEGRVVGTFARCTTRVRRDPRPGRLPVRRARHRAREHGRQALVDLLRAADAATRFPRAPANNDHVRSPGAGRRGLGILVPHVKTVPTSSAPSTRPLRPRGSRGCPTALGRYG